LIFNIQVPASFFWMQRWKHLWRWTMLRFNDSKRRLLLNHIPFLHIWVCSKSSPDTSWCERRFLGWWRFGGTSGNVAL